MKFAQKPSLEELADVMEVLRAILQERGETIAALEKVRKSKRRQRGGFSRRLFMINLLKSAPWSISDLFNNRLAPSHNARNDFGNS